MAGKRSMDEKTLHDLLECSICQEQYKDPKILPCQHSFCKECLDKLPQEEQTLKCPICREPSKLCLIKPSLIINKLLEELNKGKESHRPTEDTNAGHCSEVCKEHDKPRDTFCEDCTLAICHHCLIEHHQKHSTALISNCYDEKIQPLQMKIAQVEEKRADMEKAHESLEKAEQEILDQKKSIKEAVNATADELIHSINQSRETLLKQARESAERKQAVIQIQKNEATVTIEQLKNCAESAKLALQEGSRQHILESKPQMMVALASSIKDIEPECIEPAEKADIEYKKTGVSCVPFGLINTSYIENTFMGAKAFVSSTQNEKSIFKLKYFASPNSSFRPPVTMLSSHLLLKSSSSADERKSCEVEYVGEKAFNVSFTPEKMGPHYLEIKVGDKHIPGSPFPVHVFPKLTENVFRQYENFMCAYDVAVDNNSKEASLPVVVSLINNMIFSYRPAFRAIECPTPISIVTTNGSIFAVDEKNWQVKKFDRYHGRLLSESRRTGRFSVGINIQPCAITVHRGQLYMIGRIVRGTMFTKNVQVCILDQTDLRNHEVVLDSAFDKDISPTGIALDSNDNIYITDDYNGSVHKYSKSTGKVTSFGCHGSKGQLKYPKGLAIDKHNIVYVADTGNNRISVFDSDGQFLMCFGESLKEPRGIAIDNKSGNIFVTDSGNNRVLKFTHT